jgi:hypothetical protein
MLARTGPEIGLARRACIDRQILTESAPRAHLTCRAADPELARLALGNMAHVSLLRVEGRHLGATVRDDRVDLEEGVVAIDRQHRIVVDRHFLDHLDGVN